MRLIAVYVTGTSGRSSNCGGNCCAWESSGVTANNRCNSFGVWSRVALYPISEAPCLWWLVHVTHVILWVIQRLLS